MLRNDTVWFHLDEILKKNKTNEIIGTESRSVLAWHWGWGGDWLRDYTELSGVTECSVSTEVVGMWVYAFVKTLQNVHLKNKCILPYINYTFINQIFFYGGEGNF